MISGQPQEASGDPTRFAAKRQALLEHYGVLGTPPDTALDRLTRLASSLFDAPFAFVSLIGRDRQWFKSSHGVAVPEIDLAVSFCAHAVQAGEVLVVDDTREDARFARNPYVTGGPRWRFYAGAPLTTADGLAFGTLCVTDTRPRPAFSDAQRVLLGDLAAAVVETLEARAATRELHANGGRYQVVAETASDAIITIDAGSLILYANAAASTIFGYERDELLGHNLERLMPDYLSHLHQAAVARYLETGVRQMHWQAIEVTGLHRSGRELPLEVSFGEHVEGGKHQFTGIMRDISERKRTERALAEAHDALAGRVVELEQARDALEQSNAQLAFDAFHDRLTGLANRALLLDRLGQALERSNRRAAPGFAVMYLDSDRFKVVNDSLGHAVGDKLLGELGDRLKACVRPGDTVARLGGDEFAILLEDAPSADTAVQVADRIQRAVAKPFQLGSHLVHTSLSIGIIMSSVSTGGAAEVLRDADLAMYGAKASGRARHNFFTETMRGFALERLTLENDLRGAAERGELVVYYQPVVSLAERRLSGFEALVRWRHPRLGLVAPADFIPIAEETGLIIALDRWVLREACAQLSAWQRDFPSCPPLSMNVNLSSKQFLRVDLVAHVQRVLADTGVTPGCLKLEVTESTFLRHDEADAAMRGLRELGVKLYIDDFGTGYSSLSYLQRFPVDALKIDRSFVNNLHASPESAELVRAIIAMARTLRLEVVAEGVETPAQLAQLTGLGCGYGQGYLFAKPLPATDAAAFLEKARAGAQLGSAG